MATKAEQAQNLLFPQEGGVEEENLEASNDEVETTDETPDTTSTEDDTDATGAEEEDIEGEENSTEETPEDKQYDINSLSEEIGVEPDFLYDVKIALPDDGGEMTLGEMKDTFVESKRIADASKKTIDDYNNKRSALENDFGQLMQMPVAVAESNAIVNQINENYNSIDWAKLKEEDATQHNTLLLEYQTAFNKAQANANQQMVQYQQAQQQFNKQRLQTAQQELIGLIPEWKESTRYDEDGKQISALMSEYGFAKDEIDNLMDARQVKILYDFMKLKNQKVKGEKTLKKINKKPKMLGAGVQKSNETRKAENKAKLIKKAKSGSRLDKRKAAEALLFPNG